MIKKYPNQYDIMFNLHIFFFTKEVTFSSSCNGRQWIAVIQAITLQAVGVGEKLLNPFWDIGKTVRVYFGCMRPNVLAFIHPQLIIKTQTPTHSSCWESHGSCRLLSHLLLVVNMDQTVWVWVHKCLDRYTWSVGGWYGVMNFS